jgi:hypothetical protein
MRAHVLAMALLGLAPAFAAGADPPTPSLGAVGASTAPAPDPGAVRLLIERPLGGSLIESTMHMAEIRGTATAAGGEPSSFDVMIAIDVSESTRATSGADVDDDGQIGEDPHEGLYAGGEYPDDVWSTDPDDTILAAEVRAARALLESVDPKRVRVGLLTFSGESGSRDRPAGQPRPAGRQAGGAADPEFDRVRRASTRSPRAAARRHQLRRGIRLATRSLRGSPAP